MTSRREFALKLYLAAVWLVCAYRALTQSIVHDEGLTYELYLAGPAARMFDFFSANHHFLNTLLMRLSVSVFGLSEWSMRLPALAGAALYFAAVSRITAGEFRSSFASLLTAALLTLNPLVLDFMVAARGYGMGLGLFMWALAVLLRYVRDPNVQTPLHLAAAGAALALSIAANLIFLVPAVVLAGLFRVLQGTRRPAGKTPLTAAARKKAATGVEEHKPLASFWRYFALPAVSVAFVFFITAPLHKAGSEDFYTGSPAIMESLRSLSEVSVAHSGPWRKAALVSRWRDAIAFCIVPAILAGAVIVGMRRRNTLLLLASGTAVGSALVLFCIHAAFGFPYPADRTGIYFLALVPLALVGLAEAGFNSAGLGKAGAVFAYMLGVVFCLEFVLQFNTQKFFVWEYDADTRRIVEPISQSNMNKPPGSVRVISSWQLTPSLNFYRVKSGLTWMRPVKPTRLEAGGDYYAIINQDRPVINYLGLTKVYQGAISGTILAVP